MHSKTMTSASASKSTPIDLMLLTPAKISSTTTRAETPKSRETKSIKRVRRRTQNQQATPAKTQNGRKAHSASPPMIGCYASSKWSDSPSARSIPLPPTAWFEQTSSSLASTSDSESGSSSANDSTSPLPEPRPIRQSSQVFSTPKTCRQDEQAKNIELSSSGRRMCPLKLISEVMALSIAN